MTTPLNPTTKTFDIAAMVEDFRRRWSLHGGEAPSDEQAEEYVVAWASSLMREGWTEAVPAPVRDEWKWIEVGVSNGLGGTSILKKPVRKQQWEP